MHNTLEELKKTTVVVADTGDFQSIAKFKPQDATTNPSLILKAVQMPQYRSLLEKVKAEYATESVDKQTDRLLVAFGCEILKVIPGRVSTEVDARLSFDTQTTVARAQSIHALYRSHGVDANQRVLIKIAATWEGIQAAKILEEEGIHCNLTLLFSTIQAHACARAKVRLISPFVGRIYDWHKKFLGQAWKEDEHAGAKDPGVESVRQIYAYYKQNDIATQVMGASFRNTGQIRALAGCDLLTISPELLEALQEDQLPLETQLNVQWAKNQACANFPDDETGFRFELNQNAMATEKLSEGIRGFVKDSLALDKLLQN